ncbi:hypothetical protein FT663_05314 [Candidozyma haemuli var. vulneris]|uniref:Zn(2)-C6 fungal-type domain-containing protein n=1 Tax=Candidozyma haemuli TaxID=45357 RepID=A0A2V1ARU3_9ASCO|nr:hypothetical protein CXQ85_004308 [[Candida] haemuloni]KAF3985393.1 hypothetical protein FT663_05314 [[Candida] haemuloni var. vulneris]KAF3991768.1 hypothetical protein FT662_01522 [[Candida] haemuloni var. vulneris]PVH20800.1 hypothetical protein CXQ85_004308 [[Candida] haemuloni]
MGKEPRKRRRTIIVCNICKARKVKCDRNTPCNSCVKHRTAHLCSYTDDTPVGEKVAFKESPASMETNKEPTVYLSPVKSAKVLSGFVDYASVVGVNPLNSPQERISFFSDYSSMSYDPETQEEMNHGPFSWHSIVRVDPALADVWNFILNIKPTKRVKVPSVYTKSVSRDHAPIQVLDKIRQHSQQRFDPANAKLRSQNIPLGLTFKDPFRNKTDASHEERLLAILPSKKVLWTHVDRFFQYIYPFHPFLDEQHFRSSIERILGPKAYSDDSFQSVEISGRIDLTFIGILCLVLRMSYLSLISNEVSENTDVSKRADGDKDQHLLSCPIGIEFVDFSRFCLNQYQVSNRASLGVVQLVVYMRIYMESAPEDPDGPGRDSHQVNNGVLLQLAYSIGLNREPDKMMDTLNNPRLNNVRRKLWMFVTHKDYTNSIKFGTPFTSSALFSDTKFPFLDATNSNGPSDSIVEESIQPIEALMPIIKDVLKTILFMNEETVISEFITHLNQLESYFYEHYGTMRDFHQAFFKTDSQSLVQSLKLQYYVPIQIFIVSCYFRLFLWYESHKNTHLSFFYLKKMLVILAEENIPFISTMLEKPHPYYRYAYQFVMNPHLEYFMHKSVGFFSAVTSRLGYQIVGTPRTEYYIPRLKVLMRSLSRCCKVCLLGIHKINHRYCYAWRIGTTFTYITRVLVSEGYYKRHFNRNSELVVPKLLFSDDQIVDLVRVAQAPISNVDLSLYEVYWRTVADLIKLGQDEGKDGLSTSLFNPLNSEVVFAGEPENLQGVGIGDDKFLSPPDEMPLENFFPQFDFQSSLTDVMGTFFEGPESYFDSFSSIPRNQVVDDYGAGGRFN